MLVDIYKRMKELIVIVSNHLSEIVVAASALAIRKLELLFMKRKRKKEHLKQGKENH